MSLASKPLLGLAKDCIEFVRAKDRKDQRGMRRNHNQIVIRCAKIMGQPLKKIPVKNIDTESIDQIRHIINKSVIDGSDHQDIEEIFAVNDEESIWYCIDCNLVIFVDAPNEWAHSRRPEDGWEPCTNVNESMMVEGCND